MMNLGSDFERPGDRLVMKGHRLKQLGIQVLLFGSAAGFLGGVLSWYTKSEPPPPARPLNLFSSDAHMMSGGPPQCKAMLDSYCTYLYSPDVMGNLEIRRSQGPTKILQGETPNQFSQTFFRYSSAKLQNQDRLPKDYLRILRRHNYFAKLTRFLERKPRKRMSLAERLESEQLNFELGSIWSASMNEVILLRMNQKYAGYFLMPEKYIPKELQLERIRERRVLISEISKAIWRDDENWRQVESTFKELKSSYLKLIAKIDASEELKKDWSLRIGEVELALPGSVPAIANEECSTVTANAYYYTYLNVITVCAGDFNSEDILQTLAHEMGHVLGLERTRYLFQSRTKLGHRLLKFRENVCQPEKFKCSDWDEVRDGFGEYLDSLSDYEPELPEFQRCLKRRPTVKELTESENLRIATNIVNDRISELASAGRFLQITKSEIPILNGKTQTNPYHLNPCSYDLWGKGDESIDDELTTLMIFTAAYRCSDEPPAQKLRSSIETAKAMSLQLLQKTIAMEGEFSGRSELETEGFSSSPEERFADVLASYAMSEYLTKYPHQWERRNKVLAGASWLCIEPSLASHFPEESSVEKDFVFNPHTEGDQRRKELFSTPLRQAIGCEKDYEFNECSLPLTTDEE